MKTFLAAMAVVMAGASANVWAQAAAKKEAEAQASRAQERCRANRGVDCETPAGLQEWQLQERSRAQAVKEGSRRIPNRG